MPKIILASTSPRRKELLEREGIDFTVDASSSVPGMALIQSEIVRPQVVTAKCSEPQADTIKVGVKEVV